MIVAGALRFCGFGRMRRAAATKAGMRVIATVICTGVVFFPAAAAVAGGRPCVVVAWRIPPRPLPRGRPRGRPRVGAALKSGVAVAVGASGLPGVPGVAGCAAAAGVGVPGYGKGGGGG